MTTIKRRPRRGLCECGCGQKTTVPTRNQSATHQVSGVPMRFVKGHNPKTASAQALCTKCGGPNDRGARKRICEACLPVSPRAVARERAVVRLAECPVEKRWCSVCDEFLPPAQFPEPVNERHICSACRTQQYRARHVVAKFGITDEEYNALLRAQGGVCAICGNAPRKQRFPVDHNHKTGMIRGLLCMWCNHRLLGGARDSVQVLRSAVSYLESPPAVAVIGERMVPPKKPKRKRAVAL